MSDDHELAFELSLEETGVRQWREQQLVAAGIDDFSAFRLAMALHLDLHLLVARAQKGVDGPTLVDLYLD